MIKKYNEKIQAVINNINEVIIGKEHVAVLSLVALLAEGHVLLEDVPGVGKTVLVRTIAKSIDCEFKRIQFTPDLLPSDVTGVSIYNPKEMTFEFRPGPIMGHVILADEINRTSPRTQSALLESMEEHHVTVDGETMALKKPFFVMATQNPIEYEGTYPLPEAQLDRFFLKMDMGYPSKKEEMELLSRTAATHPLDSIEPVLSKDDVVALQKEVKGVHVEQHVQQYIVDLTRATREHEHITLGVSPRGTMALMRAAKAYAFIHNRDYVIPDDIKYVAPYVAAHRMILSPEARYEGKTINHVMTSIINGLFIPTRKGMR